MAQCRASNHRIFFGRHSLKWQSLALHQFAHAEDLKEFNTLWLVRRGLLFFTGRSGTFKAAGGGNGQRGLPLFSKERLLSNISCEFAGGDPTLPPRVAGSAEEMQGTD